jgi:thiol-disulfide isomerase/thioredoxin
MKVKIRFQRMLLRFRKHFYKKNNVRNNLNNKRQDKYIIGLILLWLLVFLFGVFRCKAQDAQGLKIGNRVPDLTINHIINYPDSSAKLADFKEKLLILDFWATWCSNCIENFPKTYALQQEFPNQLQVLLVNCKSTRDSKESITAFLDKRKPYYYFPCVVMDTALEPMFPHHTIPHYVWIRNDTLGAITDDSQLTKSNVLALFENRKTSLREKKFIRFDFHKALYVDGNGGTQPKLLFYSFLAPYRYGLNFSGGEVDSIGNWSRIDVLNFSRIALIRYAFPDLAGVNPDRIILQVQHPQDFSLDSLSETWKQRNSFSYEAAFPETNRTGALLTMQADLEKYFKVRVSSVYKLTECFILQIADSTKIIKPANGIRPETNINEGTGAPVYFLNCSIDEILSRLENIYHIPFINNTAYPSRINLRLPANITDESSLLDSLAKQGFRLKKDKKKIRFCLISDNEANEQQDADINHN